MGAIKDKIKSYGIKGILIIGIPIIVLGGFIGAFLKSSNAYGYYMDLSAYLNLGDYVINTNASKTMPKLTRVQLKNGIEDCYLGDEQQVMLNLLNNVISIQEETKINAAFIMAAMHSEEVKDINIESINKFVNDVKKIIKTDEVIKEDENIENDENDESDENSDDSDVIENIYGVEPKAYTVDDVASKLYSSEWGENIKKELDKIYAAVAAHMAPAGGVYSGETYSYAGHTYKLYAQRNYGDSFGGGTIASSGCGLTSTAIVVSGFGSLQNPSQVWSYLKNNCPNKTTSNKSQDVIPDWLKMYGLKGEWRRIDSPNAKTDIMNHLRTGMPIIYHIGGTLKLNDGRSNSYSKFGHYLTLLGLDGAGNVFVGDPAGRNTRNGYTTIDNIIASSKNAADHRKFYCVVTKP